MKNLMNKALGLVWETAPGTVAPSTVSLQQAAPMTPPVMTPQPLFQTGAAANQDMVAAIQAEVEAANLEGYDYLELKQSLKNMASLPLSEEQKIAAAFATVSATTSREKILGSLDFYMSVVDKAVETFQAAAQVKEAEEVGTREEKIRGIDSEITTMSQQILDLTNRINTLQEDKSRIAAELAEKKVKIESAQASYNASAQYVKGAMLSDRAKIEKAIPMGGTL